MLTTLTTRAALTILASAFVSAAAPAAEVKGVILGDGAKPVAGAKVRVISDAPVAPKPGTTVTGETGDDGGFVAKGLSGELVRIRVEAAGYAPLTQRGVPVGAAVQLGLSRGVRLTGIVTDRETKKPIGDVTVVAWDRDAEAFGESAYRRGISGKDGRFVLTDLPAGKTTVEARAAGRVPARLGAVPVPQDDLQIVLDVPGVLSGLVSDTSGEPVAGADVKVSWTDASGPKSRSVKTGADGRYRLVGAAALPIDRIGVKAAKFLALDRNGPAPVDGALDLVLERGGSISGTVQAYDGGSPAPFHVSVRAVGESSPRAPAVREFTDPAGSFHIDELEPGTYAIEASADRYARATRDEVVVFAEQNADAGTLTLLSRSALRGRVVDARDRAPVSGATVAVTRVDTPSRPTEVAAKSSSTETSSADGKFATKDIPDGTYEVVVEHPQFAATKTRLSFRADSDMPELTLELFRGGAVTGTVLDGRLEPVPGVRIVAAPGAAGDARITDTGSDGRYYLDGLAPGAYTITRSRDHGAVSTGVDTKAAVILEGETTTVDFDESPRITVSGVVRKGDVPVPSASVHFLPMDPGAGRVGSSTRTDSNGGFQVGLREGGVYQVSVVFGAEGASSAHNVTTVTIPDQPEVSQDIVFDELALNGTVVDAGGAGIPRALVTAIRDGAPAGGSARQTTAMTGTDGRFRLDAVDPGTYRVSAKAQGYGAGEVYPVVVGENQPGPELELKLDRGWIMRGRLVDAAGQGVPGALVVVAPSGAAESGYLPAQTDVSGRFRITAPADAPVSVAAISMRFAPAVQHDIDPAPDGNAPEVMLQATEGGTLRVRVIHRRGGPVPGARIAFRPVPLFPGSDVAVERNRPRTTDAEGVTLLTRLHPGSYLVTLAGRRDAPTAQAEVYEGSESTVVLEVP